MITCRRQLLKWSAPVVAATTLPAHAQTTVVEPPVEPPVQPSCSYEFTASPVTSRFDFAGTPSYAITFSGVINPGNETVPANPVFYNVERVADGVVLASGTYPVNANNEFEAQGTTQVTLDAAAMPGDQVTLTIGVSIPNCGENYEETFSLQ